MLHMHPVIDSFFSVASAVFFMFLFLTDASVWHCLHKPILCRNFCVDLKEKNNIYCNKLQIDHLSLFVSLAASSIYFW